MYTVECLESFEGEIEADERYFAAGAWGKAPVFGLLKRYGQVFTVVITPWMYRSSGTAVFTTVSYLQDKQKPIHGIEHFGIRRGVIYADSIGPHEPFSSVFEGMCAAI